VSEHDVDHLLFSRRVTLAVKLYNALRFGVVSGKKLKQKILCNMALFKEKYL
jgi:hypothetical protein